MKEDKKKLHWADPENFSFSENYEIVSIATVLCGCDPNYCIPEGSEMKDLREWQQAVKMYKDGFRVNMKTKKIEVHKKAKEMERKEKMNKKENKKTTKNQKQPMTREPKKYESDTNMEIHITQKRGSSMTHCVAKIRTDDGKAVCATYFSDAKCHEEDLFSNTDGIYAALKKLMGVPDWDNINDTKTSQEEDAAKISAMGRVYHGFVDLKNIFFITRDETQNPVIHRGVLIGEYKTFYATSYIVAEADSLVPYKQGAAIPIYHVGVVYDNLSDAVKDSGVYEAKEADLRHD